MSSKRDYYEVLQVTKTSTTVEIKKAYKKLAREHHPDRNPGDDEATEKFKEASEAYEVLSDDTKRKRYDQYGHAGVTGAGARGGAGFNDVGDIFDAFGDIFEGFGFGSGGRQKRRSGPPRGGDIKTSVQLDLIQAATGIQQDITFQRKKSCSSCEGSGAEPGTSADTCEYCGGQGQVVQAQGFFRVQTTCPSCRGSGQVVRHKCNTCFGSGREDETVTRAVNVPAGIDNDQHLCLRGEGDAGQQNGPRGDLYVEINVKEHDIFHREGSHLVCEVPITYSQAVLGATVQMPLINGTQDLEIPAGTPPGHQFRFTGKGMPDPHGRRTGDLFVEVRLMVPKKVSEEHEELLRQLASHEEADVHPHQKTWFETLKEFVTGSDEKNPK